MKSAFYLLSAGALAAQIPSENVPTNFIEPVLEPLQAQDNQFSFWDSIGDAFQSAGDSVASGVTSAADTVASGTVSAADTVANGVTSSADTVASGTTSAADTVASGTTSAADTVANGVATVTITAYQASEQVVDQVADDFENGADFITATADWTATTLSNGQTYITAIQSTAQACSTYFDDLNALTGGQLTIRNLEIADEILDMAFPEGAVVIDGVIITLELAEGTSDITKNVNGIIDGFQTKNYTEVVSNSFELFNTIMELSGVGESDEEGESDAGDVLDGDESDGEDASDEEGESDGEDTSDGEDESDEESENESDDAPVDPIGVNAVDKTQVFLPIESL